MDAGCSALVGKLADVKLNLTNPRDDENNSDSDDGCDGAELLAAVEEGLGADVVLSILMKNAGLIRTKDLLGNTVLHMAARDGDIGTVCNLIAFLEERQDEDLEKVFVDVNVDGDTALHLALKNRHRKVAYHLIEADMGAIYMNNNDGICPYKLAEEAGFSEVCMYSDIVSIIPPPSCQICVLTVDANMAAAIKNLRGAIPPEIVTKLPDPYRSDYVDVKIEARNEPKQWYELKEAIRKGEEDVLITGLTRYGKELLWHQDPCGETLLHKALTAEMGLFRKLVQFVINSGLTDVALLGDKNGNTALHFATRSDNFNKTICLIKVEPRVVYQVNHAGESPLYLAVKFGYEDLVKYMVTQTCLHACASEMLRNPKHATLPHLAIKVRLYSTLKVLLKHLPELVKGKDKKGWRPLSYAANKGYLDEVTYLLTEFPKSAKKRDKDGSFPIHKAVAGGHVSIVKTFYELCPQALLHIDRKGRTALHIAASYDRADILTYLTKKLKG